MPSASSTNLAAFAVARNEQVRAARGLTIRIDGLAGLSASVRAMGRDADRNLKDGLKQAMDPVLREAQGDVPEVTGRLKRSLRTFARANAVGIRSSLPYANVIHWGGTTGPGHMPGVEWSGSIYVRPSLFISRAIEHQEDEIVARVGAVMEDAAIRTGWNATLGVGIRSL